MVQRTTQNHEPGDQSVFFDLVVIGASAGGLDAISKVLSNLPANFGAFVVVVQHLAPQHASKLPEILSRRTAMRVKQVKGKELIQPGTVYIAPPDYHILILSRGFVALDHSDPVHFSRPSADRLFESAAACYGSRTIAVVLSGMGQDGSQGIMAIKQVGGMVIAQDRASSEFFGMPGAAIRSGQVDFILPLEQVSQAIKQLVLEGSY